jgi:hypothetical protein
MIKLFFSTSILTLLFFVGALLAVSEPYSPSCQSAVEKVIKAQKFLIPYQRTMELSRAHERLAYAELAVCAGGGNFSVDRTYACNEASWNAPQETMNVIAAEDDYLTERKSFEELFEQARMVCLFDP